MNSVKAAVLIQHGDNDTGEPVDESEQAKAALDAIGATVHYTLVPGEGHGFTKLESRISSTVEMVRWFEEHL
jgi:dipeptidyl aminopeptidase/acylaminoacyl peptidase